MKLHILKQFFQKTRKLLNNSWLRFLLVFLIGLGLGYYLGSLHIFQKLYWPNWPSFTIPFPNELFNRIMGMGLKTDFLQDVINIEAVLIGVAIPISLQVVLSLVAEYEKAVAKFFIREPLYIAQYFFLFLNIIISLVTRLFDLNATWWLIVMLLFSIINILIFCKFMYLVSRYVMDADSLLINKLWNDAQEIFQKK